MSPFKPVSRRNFLRLAAASGAAGALSMVGHDSSLAQDPTPPPGTDTGAEFITRATETAIDGGLAYLARAQADDGSFTDRFSGAGVGVAALAGLALMAAGHQPGRGKYGRNVTRVVDYILAAGSSGAPGFLVSSDAQNITRGQGQQSAMYSHGFGCLFLAEVCGMLPDPARQKKVKAMLEQAVAYTLDAQNKEGGWRYDKRPQLADVSVTVAQMMALRAAKNAGVFVRKSVIDTGAQFIRDCQTPDGGFSYFKGQGQSAFARSAASIVGLYSAGVYEGKEIDRGLRYLQQFLPVRQFGFREIPPQHYYYGHYYAALAMWTAGGDYWRQWFPAVRDELLGRAKGPGGSWVDNLHGNAYATAMSLIVLQLPNNYLPILQK
jgi:hypothetical protein